MKKVLVRRDNPTPERMCNLYLVEYQAYSTKVYRWNKSYQYWDELNPRRLSNLKRELELDKNVYDVISLGRVITLNGTLEYVNDVSKTHVTLNSRTYTNDELLRIAPSYDGLGVTSFDGLTKYKSHYDKRKSYGEMPKFKFV